MIKSRLWVVAILCLVLLGCSKSEEKSDVKTSSTKETAEYFKAEHEDLRFAFNSIKLGEEVNEFAGGSSLEELKALFGNPNKTESVPAGDVTLEVYTWTVDSINIVAQLYQNSTVAASISNFSFNRQPQISLTNFQELTEGMTYIQVTDKLGQPDVLSKSVSTGRRDMQAVWTSGLYTESGGQIELIFEQDALVKMTQFGLVAEPTESEK